MYRLSDIVSKQVISLKGAHTLGTAIDVLFSRDLKKADSLLLSDPEENDDKYLKLALSKVFKLGGEAIVVRAPNAPLFHFEGAANNPAGLVAYGASGRVYGRITDVEWDDGFDVTAFYAGEERLLPDSLLSFSRELIAFNDTDEKIVLPKSRPHPPKPKDKKIKVKAAAEITATTSVPDKKDGTATEPQIGNRPTPEPIEPALRESEEASPEPESTKSDGAAGASITVVTTPTGALGNREYDSYTVDTPTASPKNSPEMGAPDFSFLTGKCVTRALYSSSGRLIANENTVITPAIIADAARENKLVQLALRAGK